MLGALQTRGKSDIDIPTKRRRIAFPAASIDNSTSVRYQGLRSDPVIDLTCSESVDELQHFLLHRPWRKTVRQT